MNEENDGFRKGKKEWSSWHCCSGEAEVTPVDYCRDLRYRHGSGGSIATSRGYHDGRDSIRAWDRGQWTWERDRQPDQAINKTTSSGTVTRRETRPRRRQTSPVPEQDATDEENSEDDGFGES